MIHKTIAVTLAEWQGYLEYGRDPLYVDEEFFEGMSVGDIRLVVCLEDLNLWDAVELTEIVEPQLERYLNAGPY